MQNKEQCSLDPVVKAGRPSYPSQDAWVIGWYICRENQEELLNTLTERKDGEIVGSICNWKTPRVTKANKAIRNGTGKYTHEYLHREEIN